jgi:hypothetical protein
MSENPLPPFKHVTKVLEVQRNKVYEKNWCPEDTQEFSGVEGP